MLSKKHSKARLSPHRKIFFQLGLILTLSLIYVALEWKTVDRYIGELDQVSMQTEEFIEIPVTQRILEVKPPPPPTTIGYLPGSNGREPVSSKSGFMDNTPPPPPPPPFCMAVFVHEI